LSTSLILEATIRSLAVSLTAAALAGVAGLLLAWLTARTDLPGARSLSSLLSLPYALPPYLLGMAWVVLGNPTVGLLRGILPGQGSYGFWGITLVLASVTFALPYLELRGGFERLDASLEEAARMSGARPARVFLDVSLPLLWPALLNGVCLAFLYSLSAFGVPALLGMPVRQFVLTTLIYSQLKVGGGSGLTMGLELSAMLLGIAGIAMVLSTWLSRLKGARGAVIQGGKTARPSRVRLGGARWPMAGLGWGFFGVSVLFPWVALALSALAPVAGKFSPALWTLKNVFYVLTLADFRQGLLNSLLLASGVATAVVVAGFGLAFLAERRRNGWAAAIIEALAIPYAMPGTVLAMAILFLSTWLDLSAGAALEWMAVAYFLKYAAVGTRSLRVAFSQVDPALEEAARVSGARTGLLLRTIWVPLLKRTWSAAWLLAFLPMATELTMSVLLTGPGAATLGTVLFELQEYADQPSAAALAWMLLTLALGVGLWTSRKRDHEQAQV